MLRIIKYLQIDSLDANHSARLCEINDKFMHQVQVHQERLHCHHPSTSEENLRQYLFRRAGVTTSLFRYVGVDNQHDWFRYSPCYSGNNSANKQFEPAQHEQFQKSQSAIFAGASSEWQFANRQWEQRW